MQDPFKEGVANNDGDGNMLDDRCSWELELQVAKSSQQKPKPSKTSPKAASSATRESQKDWDNGDAKETTQWHCRFRKVIFQARKTREDIREPSTHDQMLRKKIRNKRKISEQECVMREMWHTCGRTRPCRHLGMREDLAIDPCCRGNNRKRSKPWPYACWGFSFFFPRCWRQLRSHRPETSSPNCHNLLMNVTEVVEPLSRALLL